MQVAPLIIAVAAFLVAALALAWTFALSQRVRHVASMRGDLAKLAAAGDIQGLAEHVQAHLVELVATDERLAATDSGLAASLTTALRHLGLVRFDALPGDVGEQSFAVALLDDRLCGFVLTSMHGRGAYRLYAKPITDGVARLVLTGEEIEATRLALDGTGMAVTVPEERRTRGLE